RYSSDVAGGKLYLEDEKGKIAETITIPSSGGLNIWKTVTLKNVVLKKGTNKIKVHFEKGNFNLNFLEFKNSGTGLKNK
ncbi:carbohydrate-binding domain-containing protein, partial [Flavobacterium sp. UBA6026]